MGIYLRRLWLDARAGSASTQRSAAPKYSFRTAGIAAVMLVALALAGVAQASSSGPTRGDAQAILTAGLTGGESIAAHNPDAKGAPGGFVASPDGARISPLADLFTYCQAGWHVISLGYFDFVGDTAFPVPPTRQALMDYLASTNIQFVLDGLPLATQRTSIKAVNTPDVAGAMGYNVGALLPPGSVLLGQHLLVTTVTDPVFGNFSFNTTFNIAPC